MEQYFECLDERNIYRGSNPCLTNMAPYNGKCKDLFEIPASYWEVGYGVDCTGRPNGNYISEKTGHCDIFYTCVNGNSTLTHCSPGTVFDSKSSFCKNSSEVCQPCGSVFKDCQWSNKDIVTMLTNFTEYKSNIHFVLSFLFWSF